MRANIILLSALIMLSTVLRLSPARAVLPPGAYESLAANAPFICICRIAEIEGLHDQNDNQFVKADIEIREVFKGGLNKGETIQINFPVWHENAPVGPTFYFNPESLPKPGQHFLFFLQNDEITGGYFLAAHGSYVIELDGPRENVIRKLDEKLNPEHSPSVTMKVRENLSQIYQWVMWFILTQ